MGKKRRKYFSHIFNKYSKIFNEILTIDKSLIINYKPNQ